ncbi:endonuclease/exonuclease/phosphatase family protein [Plectonema cf. radiosum LEGE 06105]|uniref:Endonuclease/exonuclease/phosphatase family protein n=1 Tax=Plectonema cf. radiosum LEGE 06105 TaxID=945769 RepID=A0A8J7F2Z0_9CYAN|nr:endonuclease/exonuclease/phosphatase family protein [Plectonema radiosum]MBE9212165.1 endonuclease/exonuclease/phosphatase family protein [Plectonema cf. radiosum LEGE 06105]
MKNLLPRLLKIGGITFSVVIFTIIIFYFWASSGSYPRNKYAEILDYPASPPANKNEFTIITYNIGYLSGLTNNQAVSRKKKLFDDNLKTVVDALKPLNADFIGIQEIDLESKRSFNINQVDELAEQLSFNQAGIAINWDKNYVPFPYLPFSAHFGRVLSGQAILSRYPITNNKRIVLDKVASKPFFYNALYLDRVAQVSEIKVNNRSVIIINVHLEAFDVPTRRKQTEYIQKLLSEYVDKYPVLLIGDFNSTVPPIPENPQPTVDILLKTAAIKSAFPPEALNNPQIATFPSDKPIVKFDYVFYTPKNIEVIEWRIIDQVKQASDHLPVMMKFRFKD